MAHQTSDATSVHQDLQSILQSTLTTVPGQESDAMMTPDEYIDLMQRMEQELYEGAHEHELQYLAALDTQEIQEMMQTHFPESQDEGKSHGIVCPICRDAWLMEQNGVISCPTGHLYIDVSYEGITLTGVEKRLAVVREKHIASGCPEGALEFQQQGPDDPALHSLIACCPRCSLWEVVL